MKYKAEMFLVAALQILDSVFYRMLQNIFAAKVVAGLFLALEGNSILTTNEKKASYNKVVRIYKFRYFFHS